MTDDLQARADRKLDEALARSGARDPREFYRTRLRELRQEDRGAYDDAVSHYKDVLLPSIVEGSDPLAAWTEYGRTLAELSGAGRTVTLDPSGRSHAYAAPADPEHLVLHLPDDTRAPALLVGLPARLTRAQRAAYDWLVRGSSSLSTAGDG